MNSGKIIFRKIKGKIVPILKRGNVYRPKPESQLAFHMQDVRDLRKNYEATRAIESVWKFFRKTSLVNLSRREFAESTLRTPERIGMKFHWRGVAHFSPKSHGRWANYQKKLKPYSSKKLKKLRKAAARDVQKILERLKRK